MAPRAVLALRDELVGREFDDPGAWWPTQPTVVGGRDRTAGGTWCATDVETGVTALVLNRPDRRVAAPGAPSRGVLPLLALAHGSAWPGHLALPGMAAFALLLGPPPSRPLGEGTADRSTPGRRDAAGVKGTLWVFDGEQLRTEHLTGTTMVTSGGDQDGKAARHLADLQDRPWIEVLAGQPPTDDPAALTVRHEHEGSVFATVFGQIIRAEPGALELQSSRTPWVPGSWQTSRF